MGIKFVDLTRQYLTIKKEIDKVIQECLMNADFIGGSRIKNFEMNLLNILKLNIVLDIHDSTYHN